VVARCAEVTEAGTFWTSTTGTGLPKGTGTFNFAGPSDLTHDDVYSSVLETDTVAVLHTHFVSRTDSGIAPGCVLSILEKPMDGVQHADAVTGRRTGGQQLYFVYISHTPYRILSKLFFNSNVEGLL
jgi:hypothetical protein